MSRILLSTFALLALLMNTACSKTASDLPLEEFFKTYRVGSLSFSPDETRFVFVSDKYGHSQPFTMPVRGGEWTRLFESEDAVYVVSWCPTDEKKIFFLKDKGGDENFRLFSFNLESKEQEALTPEGARAEIFGWSQSGFYLYYHSNERDPQFMDTYRLDVRAMTTERIFENNTTFSVSDISRDDKLLILSEFINVTSSNLYTYDLDSKEMKAFTSQEDGEASYEFADFSPDGKLFYILTDKGSEFQKLATFNRETGEWKTLLETNWDVTKAGFSHNNTYFFTTVNIDGVSNVSIKSVKSGAEFLLPPLPNAEVIPVGFSRSERYLRIYVNADNIPGDQYVYDIGANELIKLTNLFDQSEVSSEMLVKSELIHYKSFDGMTIPAWLYKPKNATKRSPVVIEVHGGPMAQQKAGYSPWIQFLVSRGFIVAAPNVRGSTGYGKSYYLADDQKWGEAPLQDVVYLKKHLGALPEADTSRTVIWGGSYGGYMVLAALTFMPEEFALGMDWVGPSNLFTLLNSVPPYWKPFLKYFYTEIGNPEIPEDSARMWRQSPVNFADRIIRPLFIVQGRNDPRVKVAESDQIVEAARKNNKEVEYMIFEDEGHGLRKRDNKLKAYNAMYDFMQTNLGMKKTD